MMIKNIGYRITKANKWTWIKIIIMSTALSTILVNSTNTKSLFIGVPASLVIIYLSSTATSDIFFPHEKGLLKKALGVATFLLIITLLGTFLILVVKFTETLSLIILTGVCLTLYLLSTFKKRQDKPDTSTRLEEDKSQKIESYLLIIPFLISVGMAFHGLLLARTGEGKISVWLTIPDFFLPIFLLSSLILAIILFFTQIPVGLKLALISLHSFLSHSVFLIVWYPGRYGDPWIYMGNARFIDNTGTFYAYKWLYSQRLIADIIKYQAHYALVIFLRRLFTIDIYWIHVFFIPLLWSISVPILAYKIAELLSIKKTENFPLLASLSAGLFPNLVYYGAISQAFSFSLLFIFLLITLLLYWVNTRQKKFLVLAILSSLGVIFAHPPSGVFALIFTVGAPVLQSGLHRLLKVTYFLLSLVSYPLASYYQGAQFVLNELLNPENLLSLKFEISTILLVFAFIGLLYSVNRRLVKGKSALMLLEFYLIVTLGYYISKYGMEKAIVPHRLPSIMDALMLPFVAYGLIVTIDLLKSAFSGIRTNFLWKLASPRSVSVSLICLFLSVQLTLALYQAHPREEITRVQPAAYELEAVLYIDSNAPGRYVVLGDTNLATIAAGFLGIDYAYGTSPRGSFGVPEWWWWSMKLYLQMKQKPSISIMEEALVKGRADIAYFVVSVREEEKFEEIVWKTSEILPIEKVFGEGKLYIFKYPFEGAPVGPTVNVTFEDGTTKKANVKSEYTDWSAVTYTVWLWGHSSYNISGYPKHWTFLNLKVNGESRQFDNQSDINDFIYIDELNPEDFLEVSWRANNLYPDVAWKEDSFKHGWQRRPPPLNGTIEPNITRDGNILSLSWNFTPGSYQWFYYIKNVSVSTNDNSYIFVRWRSTGPVAYVTIRYEPVELPGKEVAIVPINSESAEWKTTMVRLWSNATTGFVTVGITNYKNQDISGPQTVYIDYILIAVEK
jgi:hypothetical protein